MSRRTLLFAASAALVTAACHREPTPPRAAPPATPAASRPAAARDGAPDVAATVVRDGDGVFVILDVAPTDALGRTVDVRSLRIDGLPEGSTRVEVDPASPRIALGFRAPRAVPAVTVAGSSAGAAWATEVDVRLDG